MHTYNYKMTSGPYGIFITIVGDLAKPQDCDCLEKVTDSIMVSFEPGVVVCNEKLCFEDQFSIKKAIQMIDKYCKHKSNDVIAIRINSIQYNQCDFQQNGLIAAMICFCKELLLLECSDVVSWYDTVSHRYEFSFEGQLIE